MPFFSDTCNVLTNISKIKEYPFPYAGTYECLPKDIYAELARNRPNWKAWAAVGDIEANNKRLDIPAQAIADSATISPIWKDFAAYHTSEAFYHKILDNFEEHFMKLHPQLGNLRNYHVAPRFSGKEADIYMDCQLCINTPVKVKSTVNHPHVDNPLELFASLLYMKDSDDNAGGDLILHKAVKPPKFHGKREADLDCIVPIIHMPYAENSYIAFVNSPLSIHSVTEREVTDKPRLMVNISLEFRGVPLFYV